MPTTSVRDPSPPITISESQVLVSLGGGPRGVPGASGGTTAATRTALLAIDTATAGLDGTPLGPDSPVTTLGYAAVGDGGHATYRWAPGDATPVNDVTVLAPTASPASGRWHLQPPTDGRLNVLWAGALGDGTTDDSGALQRTADVAGVEGYRVYLPGAPGGRTYRAAWRDSSSSTDLALGINLVSTILEGDGPTQTILRALPASVPVGRVGSRFIRAWGTGPGLRNLCIDGAQDAIDIAGHSSFLVRVQNTPAGARTTGVLVEHVRVTGQHSQSPVVTISTISAANPAVVTTTTNHGATTGDTVTITGGTLAAAQDSWEITRLSATTFSIGLDNSAGPAGTGGTVIVEVEGTTNFEGGGLSLHNTLDTTIIDLEGDHCRGSALVLDGDVFRETTATFYQPTERTTVMGARLHHNGWQGLAGFGVNGLQAAGLECYANDRVGINLEWCSAVRVSGVSHDNGYYGVRLLGYSTQSVLDVQTANNGGDSYVKTFAASPTYSVRDELRAAVASRNFVLPVTVASSTAANPAVITTSAAHLLTSGQTVAIAGHSTAGVNGTWENITVTGATTFTIPLNNTAGAGGAAGTGGTLKARHTGGPQTVIFASGTTLSPAPGNHFHLDVGVYRLPNAGAGQPRLIFESSAARQWTWRPLFDDATQTRLLRARPQWPFLRVGPRIPLDAIDQAVTTQRLWSVTGSVVTAAPTGGELTSLTGATPIKVTFDSAPTATYARLRHSVPSSFDTYLAGFRLKPTTVGHYYIGFRNTANNRYHRGLELYVELADVDTLLELEVLSQLINTATYELTIESRDEAAAVLIIDDWWLKPVDMLTQQWVPGILFKQAYAGQASVAVNGNSSATSINVPGARPGDTVVASVDSCDSSQISYLCHCQAANNVQLRWKNVSAAVYSMPAGNWSGVVLKTV